LISEVARDLEISDPLFPVQWHLLNPIQLGRDVNVTGVWREGHFGANVTVAIVDDSLTGTYLMDFDATEKAIHLRQRG
jgi:kexin